MGEIKRKRPDMSNAELSKKLGVTPPVIAHDLELQEPAPEEQGPLTIDDSATCYADFKRKCDEKMALLQESLDNPKIAPRERIAAIRSMHDIDKAIADYQVRFLKDTPSVDPNRYIYAAFTDPGTGVSINKNYYQMTAEERQYTEDVIAWNAAWERYQAYEVSQGRAMPQRTDQFCSEHGWQGVASTTVILKCGCKGI